MSDLAIPAMLNSLQSYSIHPEHLPEFIRPGQTITAVLTVEHEGTDPETGLRARDLRSAG